jgi:predicted amidohydrolase
MSFTLAMVQMTVAGGQQSENLDRAEARIAEAATAGAHVIVLPECLDLGWTHPSSQALAEPIPGGSPYERLAAAARRHDVYVCAGLTERFAACVYNSAVLIDPAGTLLHLHRKIHELDIGKPYYAVGDRLGVVDTDYGRVGVMICADAFAPGQVIARSLALMGARVILSPSAWAISDKVAYGPGNPYGEIWRDNYRPVSADYNVWIAGVSNVGPVSAGPWAGRRCIGASLLYGPGGREVLQGPLGIDADTILYAPIAAAD